MFKEKFK